VTARFAGVVLAIAMVLGAPAWAAPGGAAPATAVQGGRYGEVHVSAPAGALRGFVVLFSALSGWNANDQQAADSLARHDMLVVGVDSARYAATLAATPEACHHLVGDAEAISHQLQRALNSSAYFTPIVAGVGQGGTLAETVLAAAATNTVAGAVSIDPEADLDARFHPCPPDPSIMHDAGLPGFWSIGATTPVAAPTQALIARLLHDGAKVEVHDFVPDTTEDAMLLALTAPHLGSRAPDEEDVSDLPLIELPAAHPSNMLAIVISGDGGWRDLDKTIARRLQAWGVSVVGIDSLRYFWSRKTPARTAHDLARVIRTYSARWHAKSVALIGYSFGADVLPFAYNRLPETDRARINLMALLGFATAADFEIRVTGWLGMPPSGSALPVRPEIARMPPELVQCFYGAEEVDTICPSLAKTGIAVIRTSGSHHFGRDYDRLAKIILDGWRRRITKG
jgi:type IV secretory pathway VirJ component